MFYSHTFLGKKGPLGTVWCAAHLQHRLRKPHYLSADISAFVDSIMFPEVPIALRLSGHLLFGVARIYSKKVDYLCQDCQVIKIEVNKVFKPSKVNLPEEATRAPFESITLPKRFELDAWKDDDLWSPGYDDHRHRNQEDITLTDQVPTGGDPYVAITFDEELPHADEPANQGVAPMEIDNPPAHPVDDQSGPSNEAGMPEERSQKKTNDERHNENDSHDVLEIELQRDAFYDNGILDFSVIGVDNRDLLPVPTETIDRLSNEKMVSPPNTADIPQPPSHKQPDLSSARSPGAINSNTPFGPVSLELQLRATPPAEMRIPRPRKRKFDAQTVLTNEFLRAAIDDPSNLNGRKKLCSSSSLGVWKRNNSLRQECVFFEPIMTGPCTELHNLFKQDFKAGNVDSTILDKDVSEKNVHPSEPLPEDTERADSDQTPPPLETLRDILAMDFNDNFESFMPTVPTLPPSPSKIDMTPNSLDKLGPLIEDRNGLTMTTEELVQPLPPTPGFSPSDPQMPYSTEFTALHMLEVDNSTSTAVFEKSNEASTLSERRSMVAKYLQAQSPVSEDLSLNKILEGKSRKLCARMFFETLVLKSIGLVDVEQQEPYGDVILKRTPALSKEF